MNTFIVLLVYILLRRKAILAFARFVLACGNFFDLLSIIVGCVLFAAAFVTFLWLIIKSVTDKPIDAAIIIFGSMALSLLCGGLSQLKKWAENKEQT